MTLVSCCSQPRWRERGGSLVLYYHTRNDSWLYDMKNLVKSFSVGTEVDASW